MLLSRFLTSRALLLAMLPLVAGSIKNWSQPVTVWYQPTPYPTKKEDGEPMPQDINIVHVWDGWFNSSSNPTLVRNDYLGIGSWNDTLTSPLKFDLTGLPATVDDVALWLYALPSGNPNHSQMSIYRIDGPWDASTVGWSEFPTFSQNASGYYWSISSSVDAWRGYNITGWYRDWKSGAHSNDGMLLWPFNRDGKQRIDIFASSRAGLPSDTSRFPERPLLGLTFTPTLQLKMPLPGNYSWVVSTEVGGYDCMGRAPWPDPYHQDSTGNYFSIDIAWNNQSNRSEATPYNKSNIPVLAAQAGTISFAGKAVQEVGNGYYVVINHTKENAGFSTRYLHLKDLPRRKDGTRLQAGDAVNQGDQIGIMGTTGTLPDGRPGSTDVHLHFGVRYKDSGSSTTPELTKVLMEGLLLKSYQTECAVNQDGIPTNRIHYYPSTMVMTGN